MRVNIKCDLRICLHASARSAENYSFDELEYVQELCKALNFHGFKVHFFSFLGFKFQSNFLGFIFQNGLDSGFKFQIGGIQDSDLGLQGPIIACVFLIGSSILVSPFWPCNGESASMKLPRNLVYKCFTFLGSFISTTLWNRLNSSSR